MLRVPLTQVVIIIAFSILVGLLTNFIRSDRIPFLAKEMEISDDLSDSMGEPVAISLTQARQLFDQGVVFVDARGDEYYQEGHIQNAWNSGFFMELIFKLDSLQTKEGPVVVYCSDDECGSSEELAYDLFREGFIKLYVFKGGWVEWNEAGYPVE